MPKGKPINLRISEELYAFVESQAQREHRSMAGYVKALLEQDKEAFEKRQVKKQ